MEDMLKDFLLGEHLLLVGNQVGHLQYTLLSISKYKFKILSHIGIYNGLVMLASR